MNNDIIDLSAINAIKAPAEWKEKALSLPAEQTEQPQRPARRSPMRIAAALCSALLVCAVIITAYVTVLRNIAGSNDGYMQGETVTASASSRDPGFDVMSGYIYYIREGLIYRADANIKNEEEIFAPVNGVTFAVSGIACASDEGKIYFIYSMGNDGSGEMIGRCDADGGSFELDLLGAQSGGYKIAEQTGARIYYAEGRLFIPRGEYASSARIINAKTFAVTELNPSDNGLASYAASAAVSGKRALVSDLTNLISASLDAPDDASVITAAALNAGTDYDGRGIYYPAYSSDGYIYCCHSTEEGVELIRVKADGSGAESIYSVVTSAYINGLAMCGDNPALSLSDGKILLVNSDTLAVTILREGGDGQGATGSNVLLFEPQSARLFLIGAEGLTGWYYGFAESGENEISADCPPITQMVVYKLAEGGGMDGYLLTLSGGVPTLGSDIVCHSENLTPPCYAYGRTFMERDAGRLYYGAYTLDVSSEGTLCGLYVIGTDGSALEQLDSFTFTEPGTNFVDNQAENVWTPLSFTLKDNVLTAFCAKYDYTAENYAENAAGWALFSFTLYTDEDPVFTRVYIGDDFKAIGAENVTSSDGSFAVFNESTVYRLGADGVPFTVTTAESAAADSPFGDVWKVQPEVSFSEAVCRVGYCFVSVKDTGIVLIYDGGTLFGWLDISADAVIMYGVDGGELYRTEGVEPYSVFLDAQNYYTYNSEDADVSGTPLWEDEKYAEQLAAQSARTVYIVPGSIIVRRPGSEDESYGADPNIGISLTLPEGEYEYSYTYDEELGYNSSLYTYADGSSVSVSDLFCYPGGVDMEELFPYSSSTFRVGFDGDTDLCLSINVVLRGFDDDAVTKCGSTIKTYLHEYTGYEDIVTEMYARFEQARRIYGWFDGLGWYGNDVFNILEKCRNADAGITTTEENIYTYGEYGVEFSFLNGGDITTMAQLRSLLESIYDNATVEKLLSYGMFSEHDGVLYTFDGARGSNIFVGNVVERTVKMTGENEYTLTLKVEIYDEDDFSIIDHYEEYVYSYVKTTDGTWVWNDFYLYY